MIRADYQLRYAVMGTLGSFWSRVAREETKQEARAVATLTANAPGLRQLDVPMRKLLSARIATADNVVVPYLEGDFVYIGPDIASFWRTELGLPDGQALRIVARNPSDTTPRSTLLLAADGRPLGQNLGSLLEVFAASDGFTGSDPLYALPVPRGLTPIVIATKILDRVLAQGIDFEAGPGYIMLRESPGDVFHAGGFTVLHGTQELPLPYNYTMQLNGESYGHTFVAAYYRGAWSRGSFERAAAQAAGLLVLEQDDTLLRLQVISPTSVRYIFRLAGPVDVHYPHVTLTPGLDYSKGHIVGNGFRVVGQGAAGWLRSELVGNICSLDGLLPVAGVYLPPTDVLVDYTEVSASGIPHARIHLTGTPDDLAALWDSQREHELLHGVYYAVEIGLSPGQPTRLVDYHAVIEQFFGPRLLVVVPAMDGYPPGYLSRLAEFIKREQPLGAVITLATSPGYAANALTLSNEYLTLSGEQLTIY